MIKLKSLGRYRDGVPDGWCWIFPPDDYEQKTQALYVKFQRGVIDTSNVVMVDIKKEKAWIGSYSDGKFLKVKNMIKLNIVLNFRWHKNKADQCTEIHY